MNAHFVITGAYLMDRARDLMLSDDPGSAWRLLQQCLIGVGVETAIKRILAGEAVLTGDSSEGLGLEDADPEDDETRKYNEDLRYVYAGRVRLDGRWFRPRAVITSYGRVDVPTGRIPTSVSPTTNLSSWARERAKFYAGDGERVAMVGDVDDTSIRGRWVIFEPCAEPPQWVQPVRDATAAVAECLRAGRALEIEGAHKYLRPSVEVKRMIAERGLDDDDEEAAELRAAAEAAEEALFRAEIERIGEAVREQAGDDLFPLTLGDGRVVQVPRAPFTRWALGRVPDVDIASLPPWDCVSESGIKMYNDDPCHTDWVLGAGLSIAEGYSEIVNGPAWDAAFNLQVAEVDRE